MLNYDWLLSGEAVDAAEAGDASLKHSLRTWVTGWFQACFQMCLDNDDALSSSYGVSFFWGACGVLLPEGDFPCCDLLAGWGPFQGPSRGSVPEEVGSQNK